MKISRLPVISLFTGAGGLDIGLEQAGFTISVCVESDKDRCKTIELNRPDWRVINRDIRKVSTKEILETAQLRVGEAALLSAGPPCQPFSKSAFWAKGSRVVKSDLRTRLLSECVRVIAEARPGGYLIENVRGLAYRTASATLEALTSRLEREGYSYSWAVLNAADYSVPQKRERIFILGAKDGSRMPLPEPTRSRGSYVTAGDAIGDLDDGVVKDDEMVRGKWGHLLSSVPPGGNYLHLKKMRGGRRQPFKRRSRYWSFLLKLSPDKPSWTIQATPGTFTGPFHWNNRRLRIPELKRLQTFPDDWLFYGGNSSVMAQIGDAVPPLLAREIGKAVVAKLAGITTPLQTAASVPK